MLRESGIQLPSQRTLRDYTHYDQADVVFSSGVDAMLMERFFIGITYNKFTTAHFILHADILSRLALL